MIRYFDTSAVAKVLNDGQNGAARRAAFLAWGRTWLSSQLAASELHRLAGVWPLRFRPSIRRLGPLNSSMSSERTSSERTLGPALARTFDVVHVAMAAQCVVTYNTRQMEVARSVKLAVVSPR